MNVDRPGLARVHALEAVAELRAVVTAVVPEELDRIAEAVADAPRVFLTGSGRSGLVAKTIAMRLMHIGLTSFVVGDVTTPAIGARDLLVAFSARGGSAVTAQIEAAHGYGALVASFTSSPSTPVAAASDRVVVVPARGVVPTAQHAGSLFEQACLVLGDATCRAVQETLDVPSAALDARHANLQ